MSSDSTRRLNRRCTLLLGALLLGAQACKTVSRTELVEVDRQIETLREGLAAAERIKVALPSDPSANTVVNTMNFTPREKQGVEFLTQNYGDYFDRTEAGEVKVLTSERSGTSPTGRVEAAGTDLEARIKDLERQGKDLESLFGVKWGAGVGVLAGGSREIQEASIVNGLVTVTKSRKAMPAVLLEAHTFLWQPKWDLMQFGVGPFATLGISNDQLVDGVGGGLIFGGRRLSPNSTSATAFNIAIGPYLIGELQQLAAGFVEGQAPPAGETAVRYRTEEDWKLLVMFSFSWGF